ncbi:hypothetical protein GY45DRAFT_433953 [Cubamyces sp. BRFM 1775]|nr:hypothetical protein GY45DRAFT_433953 [Cubamyces sp. BRFM 1775]
MLDRTIRPQGEQRQWALGMRLAHGRSDLRYKVCRLCPLIKPSPNPWASFPGLTWTLRYHAPCASDRKLIASRHRSRIVQCSTHTTHPRVPKEKRLLPCREASAGSERRSWSLAHRPSARRRGVLAGTLSSSCGQRRKTQKHSTPVREGRARDTASYRTRDNPRRTQGTKRTRRTAKRRRGAIVDWHKRKPGWDFQFRVEKGTALPWAVSEHGSRQRLARSLPLPPPIATARNVHGDPCGPHPCLSQGRKVPRVGLLPSS